MTQQQISTPSVIEILDSRILSSAGYTDLGIALRDPWNDVLTALEARALTPSTVIAGMDGAASPNAVNPFITKDFMELKLGNRGLILVGLPGSDADYMGTTDVAFTDAIAALPPTGGVIAVLAGTYTFNSAVTLPESVRVVGIHPLSVTIQGSGDQTVFELAGDNSRVEFLTIENPSASSVPVVNMTGSGTAIIGCRVRDYLLLGVGMVGSKAYAKNCLIESDGSGIWLQGIYQVVESCSFSGTMSDGVLHFENSMCSALSNFIQDSVTGASYLLPSPTCAHNKLVANHLGLPAAVALSVDAGTATVKYANTPDTPLANENNFLVALQSYTGQPALDSTEMVLSNHFAHDYTTEKDATTILSSLDLVVQRIYEERNWYLTSANPSFDSVGVPTSGVFSWDGTTLTWPNFEISSLVPNNTWTIAASSIGISAGNALVLDIDRTTPGALTPTLKSLSLLLENPADANQYVLAFSPASGVLVWTRGFRLLTALTSFDVDGLPLPIARFIGIPGNDLRNTPVMPTSFAIGDDLTEKLSHQSALLESLYKRTNLWEYSDGSIDMTPKVGSWLALTTSQPEDPTHLIQIKGTTYSLFPNNGVYRWWRETAGDNPGEWGVLPFNPAGVGPYASMSQIGTNLALLTCAGSIVIWDADAGSWSTLTPTTSVTLPLVSSRPVGHLASGQSDFMFQTPDYSIFTLVDGRTLLYFKASNILIESQKISAETPKGVGLLGRHLKDSGFNIVKNHWIDTVDNGANSTLEGLPLAGVINPPIEIPLTLYSSTSNAVKWDTLRHESFSYEPQSGAYLDVATDGSATFYIVGGGYGNSKLLSKVIIGTTSEFTNFTPHGWLTHAEYQEVICFGATLTFEFTVIVGKVLPGENGTACFSWTRTVLGVANSNTGSIGLIDRYNKGGTGDIHILASDVTRLSRPTWWQYTRSTSTWSSATLADAGGSVTLPQAVAGCFTYNAITDRMAGFGVAAPKIQFLVRDTARGNRPTLFSFDGTNYTSVRLSETPLVAPADVAVAGADGNSVSQFYGGIYQNAWNAVIWACREGSTAGNQLKVFTYLLDTGGWSVMSVGSGGTYLNTLTLGTPPFLKRTGSLVTAPTLTAYEGGASSRDLFIWTPVGLLKGTLTGSTIGMTGASWVQFDKRVPAALPVFSTLPMNTYSPTLGSSRCDLSMQIGSLAEKGLDLFGSGLTSSTYGVQWFDPGIKVKQISSTIWAGLNTRGIANRYYLWIADLTSGVNIQRELTPDPNTVRGDIQVINLGYVTSSDDFDWSFDGTQSQIAFVFKDANNSNRLAFILYDIGTHTVVAHERGGASGVVPLASTPRIAYNSINNSWSIVAQQGAATSCMFFRRLVTSNTWIEESAVASGLGINPARPRHHTDGSVVLATETSTANFLVSKRLHATGVWSPIYSSSGGGFTTPRMIATTDNTTWWVFGGQGGRIAWSTDPMNVWSIWSGSPTLANLGYTRVSTAALLPLTSSVIVATSALADGLIPASREILIWRFNNDGTANCIGAFTAKGRLQSTLWVDEEDGITDLSWTPDQKLLYGATRPTRTSLHWSLRGSTSSWNGPHGDSLLGSGRFLTLGEKHFRELWGSAAGSGGGTSGQEFIIEYPSLTSWSSLPLAYRTSETDFTSLKWPFLTSSGFLFTTGSSSTGLSDDAGLASGSLITSASRGWPLVLGNTRWSGLSHTGPSVFTQGSMLGLYVPVGSTNLAYFGNATIGSNNLFKLQALAAVTFYGTRTWRDMSLSTSPLSNMYVLVGPVQFEIDTTLAALGSHLVLEFNTPSSLVLDPAETPLSYWTATDHSDSLYAVVVGEIQEQTIMLYPATGARGAKLLTFGHLEPIELLSLGYQIGEWEYDLPYDLDLAPMYEIISRGSTSFALREPGSLRGLQTITFTPGVPRQLALRRQMPKNGWFVYQSSEVTASSGKINALASLITTMVSFDKLIGDLP